MANTSDGEARPNSAVEVGKLLSFFERIQRLEEEAKEISEHKADIRAEAKALGYDMKAFGKAYSLWKLDPELRAMVGTYTTALGVFE